MKRTFPGSVPNRPEADGTGRKTVTIEASGGTN
jgi:hypothetical protein